MGNRSERVRQRTLLSLGKVGEDRLDELITAIARHKEILGVMDIARSLSISDTTILGPLLILQQVFAQFGVDAVLSDIVRRHPKLAFDFQRIVFTLVVCRFIRPGSKLRVFDYWQDKLYPGLVSGKDELHHIYRALDLLHEHKEDIEQGLFWHQRDLLSKPVDVVLYDLTTLRFESVREDLGELRRFGYSKEMSTILSLSILMVFSHQK